VIVIGVPGTWPVQPVHGALVSCFLTPDVGRFQYTHPRDLGSEIEALVGRYLVDVEDFRTDDKDRVLTDIEAMTERRFRVAEHLLATREWDLFFMVEIGTDRIHHGFWRYTDPSHRLYAPGNRFSEAILGYYRRLDARIARLLEFADDETSILVVSDHGAKPMDGGICINEWLHRNGYLVLLEEPANPTPLRPDMVNWERTKAWGEGGYYCRLFLNVEGREPQGTVPVAQYETLRDELKTRLEALGDDQGRPIGTLALRPDELYEECNGVPPDLLVYFGNLSWRSVGKVGMGTTHVYENDTGPDDANHAKEGMYILHAPGVPARVTKEQEILDIAPTILGLLGEPIPASMEGSSMLDRQLAGANAVAL
jgi:predicted AlkP superfamily phosphohydrolase/phosphomutase